MPSGCKTRSSLIQNISRFSRWKSLHRQYRSMTRNCILLKSWRLWSDSPKCWLTGRNDFFHVSIQAFVEGLLRLANALEATNWTLKNANNICTLAINSTNYLFLFSGDLTGIRWRVLHMSTTFAVFVSTWVTLAYSCAGLEISARTNMFFRLFGCLKATMGDLGKILYCLDFFRRIANVHEWCWSSFSDSGGMWGHNWFFYISVFLYIEINCSWRCYELC
jgi:hypothetical protein